MNIDHHHTQLLEKERELTEEIPRRVDEAREARTAEVEDSADSVISSEGQASALFVGTIATDTLKAVRGALGRIKDGTYGICIDCERPIEPARLEAVPWTPYCLADQEKHDHADAQNGTDLINAASF